MQIARYSHIISDKNYISVSGDRPVISVSLPAPPWIEATAKPVHLRQRGSNEPQRTVINGVAYPSLRAAARELGVTRESLVGAMRRGKLDEFLAKMGKKRCS